MGWSNINNPETQATLGTRHIIKTYKTTYGGLTLIIRENRRSNAIWTIQRHRQHWEQDTEQRHKKQQQQKTQYGGLILKQRDPLQNKKTRGRTRYWRMVSSSCFF